MYDKMTIVTGTGEIFISGAGRGANLRGWAHYWIFQMKGREI